MVVAAAKIAAKTSTMMAADPKGLASEGRERLERFLPAGETAALRVLRATRRQPLACAGHCRCSLEKQHAVWWVSLIA